MSMHIATRWLETAQVSRASQWESAADNATLSELELSVAGLCMTRAEDSLNGEVRRHAVLSANRLAEWLVWNWWRLCFEPRRNGKQQAPGWLESHGMAAVGGGWLWPNVTFASDGVRMRVSADPSAASAQQPLRYLSAGHAVIPLISFEDAVDDFVERACERLVDQGQTQADLLMMRQELQAERADPELAIYRQLEALLGFDPDECPETLVAGLYQDIDLLGLDAITELAAGAGNAAISADQLQSWARSKGGASSREDRIGWSGQDARVDYQLEAWRNGVKAAHALREQENVPDTPISNTQLAEWFAVQKVFFEDQSHNQALAYDLALKGESSRVLLRSKWPVGRRFEVARLLGDGLLRPAPETLHLATAQNTYRQKLQRAFAAELLCPIGPLTELLSGEYSDDALQGAADVFGVSPMTVTMQLLNNHVLQSDELNGYDLDLVTA
ncbi:hypothetical protein [Halopseudomonas xiamenensis]|uniref:hypothetical protein n=1 Tax=Halopseudomonas xiamenensis TaxID=157792 RepID=UPI0016297053|nr:hypothetical protein [Halopseudomonas xiamenensis]